LKQEMERGGCLINSKDIEDGKTERNCFGIAKNIKSPHDQPRNYKHSLNRGRGLIRCSGGVCNWLTNQKTKVRK